MKYAYTLFLKFSVRCIHPNYLFYSFKCVRRVCPNLSSAPCILRFFEKKYSLPLHLVEMNTDPATDPDRQVQYADPT
jgi:hypothetical protein